jgi:hypothetical protein
VSVFIHVYICDVFPTRKAVALVLGLHRPLHSQVWTCLLLLIEAYMCSCLLYVHEPSTYTRHTCTHTHGYTDVCIAWLLAFTNTSVSEHNTCTHRHGHGGIRKTFLICWHITCACVCVGWLPAVWLLCWSKTACWTDPHWTGGRVCYGGFQPHYVGIVWAGRPRQNKTVDILVAWRYPYKRKAKRKLCVCCRFQALKWERKKASFFSAFCMSAPIWHEHQHVEHQHRQAQLVLLVLLHLKAK